MRAADRGGWALALVALLALSGCGSCGTADRGAVPTGSLPRGDAAVDLDPADFTVDITNEYWPMRPGDRWVYASTDAGGTTQQVEVTVLEETYTVAAGIEARVVHDVVSQDGAVVEDTRDWYAQDADGNVWYLGEQTTEYPPGEPPSTEGSWETGVDGAQPGIAVPADPRPGLAYRQEHLAGEAEDRTVVLSTDEQVQTPTGSYTGALLTRETTPLEPDVAELKFYVPGVGQVLTLQTSGGSEREELVEVSG
ncbi:hypothetical protein [Geodermatophilus sp. URMC 64]